MTTTTLVILGLFIVPIFLAFVYKKVQKANKEASIREMEACMKELSRKRQEQVLSNLVKNKENELLVGIDTIINTLENKKKEEEDNNLGQQILEDKVSNIKIEIEDYVNALNKLSKSFTGLPESGFSINKFEHEVLTGLKHTFLNYTTNIEQFASSFLERLPSIITTPKKVENKKVRIKTYDTFALKPNYIITTISRETFNLIFKHFETLDYKSKTISTFFSSFNLALSDYVGHATKFLNLLTEIYDEKFDEDNKRYFNLNYVREQINSLVKILFKIHGDFYNLKKKFSYFIETNVYVQLVDSNIDFNRLSHIDFTKDFTTEDKEFIDAFLKNVFVNTASDNLSLFMISKEILQRIFNTFNHNSFLVKEENSFKFKDSSKYSVECKISFKNQNTLNGLLNKVQSVIKVRNILKYDIPCNARYSYYILMLFMYSYGVSMYRGLGRLVEKSSLFPCLKDLVVPINSEKWITDVNYPKNNYYVNIMYNLHILHYIEQVEIFKSKIQDIREKPATRKDYKALINFKFKILEFINLYFYSERLEFSSPKTEIIEKITYKKMYDAYVKFLIDGQEVFLNPNKTLYSKAYYIANILLNSSTGEVVGEKASDLESTFLDLEEILLWYNFETL